jgi:SAM-dependent methyltransferase
MYSSARIVTRHGKMTDTEQPPIPIPWSHAYNSLRASTLNAAVHDRELLARFNRRDRLPPGYGRAVDERCVEYPWLVANIPSGRGRLLDAGSTLNYEFLFEHPLLIDKTIHIVTLAPEQECFWKRGVSYLFEDFRALPFRDGLYDIVVSVSSLEHVGCDNTFCTGAAGFVEQHLSDYLIATRELTRVLKPNGLLLLTVPYGRYQFHGAFQQFDRRQLSLLESELAGSVVVLEKSFYRYSKEGWQVADDEECQDCEYVAWVAELMRTGKWPEPTLEPDYAAAARAVVCLKAIRAS